MEIPILKDIVIIFGLSIAVLLIFHKLRVPSIVGFLITGILAGPQGLGLIKDIEQVKILAEIGIVVLLFTLGMEFSLKRIFKYKRYFFLAGPIQVGLTVAGGIFAGYLLNRPLHESIFLGFLLSLSSTAIVLRMFQERAETNTPHGQLSLGILIFQDIIAIPMMLLIPFLAGTGNEINESLFIRLGEGLLILAVTFFSAMQLVPTLLYYVTRTRSRELFLLTVLVICFSVAWVTSSIGLSLALGAFLAGLVISESEYSTQAIGDVLPFQDIFTSFFFVSIGMLFDIDFLLENPISICVLTIGVFLLKSIIVTSTALTMGFPIRTAVLSGLALSQVGEFSFVLAMSGISHHIGTDYLHQLFIAVAVLTMGLTPTMIALSPAIASIALKIPFSQNLGSGMTTLDKKTEKLTKDHIIIIGYGFSGRNLARSAQEAMIPYVIIDMNPEAVREEKAKGEHIYFGDATRLTVLKHANLQEAKVLAVLVNDPIAALRIVEQAKHINPSIYIIVRTRYLEEMRPLFQLGADDVIPDELGTSVEIFTRVLLKYNVSFEHIEQLVNVLRIEGYELLRPRYSETTIFSDIKDYLSEVSVKTLFIKEDSPIAGKTLEQSQLRKKYGLTVLVIKRGNDTIYNLESNSMLMPGDQIVIVGTNHSLEDFFEQFG
jgi:CPA2 family monovalent cation:H+ antiporter-2